MADAMEEEDPPLLTKEEAIEWAKRAPMLDGDIIEVRQVQELEDFSPEVRRAAGR